MLKLLKSMNGKILWIGIFICILMPLNVFPQQNIGKLIALLANPMMTSTFGQFSRGERVYTPKALLRVVDFQASGNQYLYLVAINDHDVITPFYIITNRRLNIMDIEFPNTVFEDLELEYVGEEDYFSNNVPRKTFLFKME